MFVDKRLSEKDPSEVKNLAEGDIDQEKLTQQKVCYEPAVVRKIDGRKRHEAVEIVMGILQFEVGYESHRITGQDDGDEKNQCKVVT